MTSKEALEILQARYKCVDSKTYREMLNAIEKDLEVLDILKRHPEYINFAQRFELTEEASEELKKVKEWLENDK